MKRIAPWLTALSLLLTSCGQVLLPTSQKPAAPGMITSSATLNPPLVATPTPAAQVLPGLTPVPLGSATPFPTPNPIVTPHSYVKEHAYSDINQNGQQWFVIVAGDRRPSPPPSPTPVLQNQRGEYPGNFTYNLQIWNWNPTTNQYALAGIWPNDPTKRYVDMRYHLVDLEGNGQQQILVEARQEGVANTLDWEVLSFTNTQLTPVFGQSGLEQGQVRIIGKNIWQEQSMRQPNESACCPETYRDDAFAWNGTAFVRTSALLFPTPASFPPPTPAPLSLQATPVPIQAVSVPIPSH
ncbi:MAG TPA: hypothetical protein VMV93_09430 [Chloroflexota bacterium]|nr:hypothetical protein [Chloroflexota bacterium]